jgi:hypothetical protein
MAGLMKGMRLLSMDSFLLELAFPRAGCEDLKSEKLRFLPAYPETRRKHVEYGLESLSL